MLVMKSSEVVSNVLKSISLSCCAETGLQEVVDLGDLLVQQFIGSGFAEEAQVGFRVGRTDVQPPLGELDPVAVEVHEGGRLFLGHEMILDGVHRALLVLHAVVDLAGVLVADDLRDGLAEGLAFLLQVRDDVEDDEGGQQAAVAVEEIAEVEVSGQLAAPDAVDFAELCVSCRTMPLRPRSFT